MLLPGMDNTVVVQKDHTVVPSVPLKFSGSEWFMCFSQEVDVLPTGLVTRAGLTALCSIARTRTPKFNSF